MAALRRGGADFGAGGSDVLHAYRHCCGKSSEETPYCKSQLLWGKDRWCRERECGSTGGRAGRSSASCPRMKLYPPSRGWIDGRSGCGYGGVRMGYTAPRKNIKTTGRDFLVM